MCTILVIDDEKEILKIIQKALLKFGHSVEIASHGKEGIQKFYHGSFDVVITDIHMPDIDGNEVIEHIRNSEKSSTPVIAISGTPVMLKSASFDILLSKPFSIPELVRSVQSLVGPLHKVEAED